MLKNFFLTAVSCLSLSITASNNLKVITDIEGQNFVVTQEEITRAYFDTTMPEGTNVKMKNSDGSWVIFNPTFTYGNKKHPIVSTYSLDNGESGFSPVYGVCRYYGFKRALYEEVKHAKKESKGIVMRSDGYMDSVIEGGKQKVFKTIVCVN